MMGGMSLLSKGFRLLTQSMLTQESGELFLTREFAFYMSLAIALGFLKGRFVLRKTATRIFQRITDFPGSLSLFDLYDKKTSALIFFMFFLGFLLTRLPISPFSRGFMDIAIGTALCQGALFFFRFAVLYRKQIRS